MRRESKAELPPPSPPDWLTPDGAAVWENEITRVTRSCTVGNPDSTMFASYCNLQGAISAARRVGDIPPASAMTEARRMASQFGLHDREPRQ